MALESIYSQVPARKVGELVQGQRQGGIRYGEVLHANARHFIVRWEDGFRNTCMQGFAYCRDDLQTAVDQEEAREAIDLAKRMMR